ncbi:SMEK domain-containing protein [Halalkalibaculum sp. DA3122]|uniref:SMEK domain-containing protein n=1 Tax=Halalkalibaculum sp. DA3122 TaxID=3373607 RepID=UPI00375507B8
MRRIKLLDRINVLLARFTTEVRGHSSMGFTDIHKASENVLLPLFKIIYELPDLRNLNTEISNHPAVDLGDKKRRVAFQITSKSGIGKIESTFQTFYASNLEEEYDTVIFFFLSPKKSSYSKERINEIVGSKINFDPGSHIKDFDDLLNDISQKETPVIGEVLEKLEYEFGESKKRYKINYDSLSRNELLYPNLLKVHFPDELYVADYNYERKKVIKNSKDTARSVWYTSPEREVAKAAMHQKGLHFSNDWIVHNKQIITFHDLTDESLPLSQICDLGTATRLTPSAFYKVDRDLENVFKNLLWRCLQQMLYKNGVSYQHEVGIFIFTAMEEEEVRKEEWRLKRKSERTVYQKKMRDDKPDKVDVCNHLAFDTNFELLNDTWYMLVKPDWFFSYNGYNKSSKSADKVKYKKKKENNKQVYEHFNFISYFLRNIHEKQPDMFDEVEESSEKYFLRFKSMKPLDNAPNINDKKWLEKEPKERKNVFEQGQTEMVL